MHQTSEAGKDTICALYLSERAPGVIADGFAMSEMGVRSVLKSRNIPLRSYAEAARCANRPESEKALRDKLAEYLKDEGFTVETEASMLAGGRSDILGRRGGTLLLVEVKVGKPLHGIGQLFGYRVGLDPRPDMILAVSETWLGKSPKSSAAFLKAACRESGIRLWGVGADGVPCEHAH